VLVENKFDGVVEETVTVENGVGVLALTSDLQAYGTD